MHAIPMQPIGDYIKKLLYQYDCLVVPGLGGFLTHSVSASFQESTGLFLPPRRQVAFNGALVLDDGILLTYLMLHEGVSRDEAMRAMQAFVQTLSQHVRQTGSFTIDGLGMFTHNAEEKLQFEPELRLNFLASTYGMQPVLLPGRIIHLAQPVVRRTLEAASSTQPAAPAAVSTYPAVVTAALTQPELDNLVPLPTRTRSLVVGWRWVAAAALLVGSLGLASYLSMRESGSPFQSSLNPAALLLPSVDAPQPVTSDKSAGTSAGALPVEPAPVGRGPTAILSHEASAGQPVAPASAPAGTPDIPANRVDADRTESAKGEVGTSKERGGSTTGVTARVAPLVRTQFTVIAGSFASRRNAVRFQKRLVKAGYADAYIIAGGSLIKVAATGAATYEAAEAGIDSLRGLTHIKPWIMRNR